MQIYLLQPSVIIFTKGADIFGLDCMCVCVYVCMHCMYVCMYQTECSCMFVFGHF